MQSLSIAICGCGPAGLAAALFLHKLGHSVVLVERFAQPRPIGSGLLLQPAGQHVLDRLGLGERMRSLGTPIHRLFGKTIPSGRTVLDVRYAALKSRQNALGVHRSALFDVLFGAVSSAGLAVETGFEIIGLDRADQGKPLLRGANGRRLGPFDLVVDALGSRSPLVEAHFGPCVHRPLPWGAVVLKNRKKGGTLIFTNRH